ncbi:MAG: ABC transporter permease [Verrucomicrobiota bacterium]
MSAVIRQLGRITLQFLSYLGQLMALIREITQSIFFGRRRFILTCRQMATIGFGSQLVIVITGAFTGAVFAAQSFYMFNKVGLESGIGAVVSLAMSRELGPVLTGLMLAGRVGAAMAAEIGTMKVTEQIDALRSMAVHPIDYLVVPRLIGMVVSMPLLIAESIAFGLIAAYLLSVKVFGIPDPWFLDHVRRHTELTDIALGMSKGIIFGLIIVIISCHQGLTVKNGAVGVGRGTTAAVVFSSLAILMSNFFLTVLINIFFPIKIA